jgi:protein pelota
MDVLGRDQHEWRLRVQTVDDLWVLQRLIQPGMSVGMLGERRDQTTGGEAGGRAKQAERKKMWIRLSVGHTEHQTFSDVLRVHGIIEEAPLDIGMHHTHVVGLRDDLKLSTAKGFSKLDRDLLEESLRAANQPQVALLVVEGDEIILFFVTARGLKESATWTMRGGGKRGDLRQTDSIAGQFRKTVVNGLSQQLNETMPLVLCGPGRNRDRVLADLNEAGHNRPMLSVGTTMGGRSAANEVLREGLAGEMLAQHRMVQEIGLLEEAWQRISTGGAVAYGRADIRRATEEGAVETLLIGADILREDSEGKGLPSWTALAEKVEAFSGKVVQCSLDHDAGEQLVGFGGAVALLRYAM